MLKTYETFLVNNNPTITSIETTLRSLTWFLPGRFKDAELASEALSTFINVLGLYHDHILAQLTSSMKFKPLIPLSPHFRYTRAWVCRSKLYQCCSAVLELIRFTELLVEMTLRKRFNNRVRWCAVILLEFLKAILRATLLIVTRRPIVSPSIAEREIDPATTMDSASSKASTYISDKLPLESGSTTRTPDHLKNNHTAPTFPQDHLETSSYEEILSRKAILVQHLQPPVQFVGLLDTFQAWSSELLYIVRPLLYAISLNIDRSALNPVLLSAMIDLLSRTLRRTPARVCNLERSEYARRDRDLLWYFLRGDVWKLYTRYNVEKMVVSSARYPIASLLGHVLQDWIVLIDSYFYYSSS